MAEVLVNMPKLESVIRVVEVYIKILTGGLVLKFVEMLMMSGGGGFCCF